MSDLRKVKKITQQKKRRSAWRKVVTCIAALVVFCTTYALILPAITMEKSDYTCGLVAHTHTEDCYQLACGRVEIFSHTHGADCYDAAGDLICPYPQQTLHHHTADCYRASEPQCGIEASEGHTHSVECLAEDGSYACGLTASEGHTHTDACYIASEPLCGQEDVVEHRHTDSCYRRICELEAHTHDESCVSSHEGFLQNGIGQPTEATDPTDGAAQPTDAPAETDPTGATDATDVTEPTAETGATDATEVTEATEATTEPTGETEPTDATDPTDVTEATDETEPERSLAAMMFSLRATARETVTFKKLDDAIVKKSFKINSQNVIYEDDYYSMDMALSFTFQTVVKDGSAYIKDENGNNAGLSFVKDLGEIKLPDGFNCNIDNPAALMDSSTPEGIFYFEQRADGHLWLYIVMDESYVKSADEKGITATIQFEGAVSKEFSDTEGNVKYPGDQDIWINIDKDEIEYPENESNLGDINVTKSGSFSYNDDGTLSYTVEVSSKNGTSDGEIAFTDEISLGNLKAELSNVKVDGSDATYTQQDSKISMTLSALEGGQKHTVTYTYKLDEASKALLSSETATQVGNKVHVEATPKDDKGNSGKTIEKETTFDMDLKKPEKDVHVQKNGDFNYSNGTLTYTVTVTSQNGSPGKIYVEDVLDLIDLNATLGDVSVSKKDKDGNVTNVTVPETNKDTYSNKIKEEGGSSTTYEKKISVTLDPLGVGESYTITYTYTLDNKDAIPSVATGNAKNTVKVASKPDDEPDEKSDKSNVDLDIHKPQPSISKSNDWNDQDKDKTEGSITWTLILNEEHYNIAGEILRDQLSTIRTDENGNRVDGGAQNVFLNSFGFTNKDGTTTYPLNTLEVWVKENGENEYTKKDSYADFFTVNEDGTITFKPLSDGTNTCAYKLHYKTTSEPLNNWGYNSVTNTAEFFGKKAFSTIETDEGNLEKTNDGVKYDSDKKQYYIDWTIILTPGADGLRGSGFSLYDYSYLWNADEDDYIDRSSLKVTLYEGGYAEEKTGVVIQQGEIEGNTNTYNVIWMKGNGDIADKWENATSMQITFNGGNAHLGDQVLVTYRTYVNNEDKFTDNPHTFYNRAWYAGKSADSNAKLTKDSFVKTDGNDSAADSAVENLTGELTWKLKTTVGTLSQPEKVTMTDDLPEHVHVTSIAASVKLGNDSNFANLSVDDVGEVSGEVGGLTFSGTLTKPDGEASYRLNIDVVSKGADYVPSETEITLTLKCQIDEDHLEEIKGSLEAGGTHTENFKNKGTGSFDDLQIGSDEQTQSWTYKKESNYKNSVSKTGTWNKSGQTLNYSIALNPDGKDLDSTSAMVTVTDEFSYKPKQTQWIQSLNRNEEFKVEFNLVPGSVKLYYATKAEDGSVTKGSELEASKWSYITSVNDPTADFPDANVTNIIKLSVPDGTPLVLEYAYQMECMNEEVAKNGFSVSDITNRAYFTGNPDESGNDNKINIYWQEPSASGNVSITRNLTILKVDAEDASQAIPGAKFKIYPYVLAEDGETGAWSETAETRYEKGEGDKYVSTDSDVFTTDENGKIVLGHYSFNTHFNTLYKLVEVEAAEGYLLDKDAPPTVYFYFSNDATEDSDGNLITPAYENLLKSIDQTGITGIDLAKASQTVTIKNTSSIAKFSVIKSWRDSDGNKMSSAPDSVSSVFLQLWQQASLDEGDTTVSNPLADTVTIRVTLDYSKKTLATFTVARGSVINFRFTTTANWAGDVVCYPIGGFSWETKTLESSSSTEQGVCTTVVSVTADYSKCIDWRVRDNEYDLASFTYTVTSPSSGSNSGSMQENSSGESVTFKPKEYGTIVLNSGNNWTWYSTSENLPKQGKETVDDKTYDVYYTYYVTELTAGDWDVSYSNKDGEGKFTAVSTGNITVTNTLPPPPTANKKDISVSKTWSGLGVDDDGKQTQFTSVNFKLYRSLWSGEGVPSDSDLSIIPDGVKYVSTTLPAGVELVYTGTLSAENGWQWSSKDSGLDLYSQYDGKYYTYFILEEDNSDHFEVTNSGQVYDGGDITLTNKITREYGSISVEKQWVKFDGTALETLPTGLQNLVSVNFEMTQWSRDMNGTDGYTATGKSVTFSVYPDDKTNGDGTTTAKWTWNSGDLLKTELKDNVQYDYAYEIKEVSYTVKDGDGEKTISLSDTTEQIPFTVTYSGLNFGGIVFKDYGGCEPVIPGTTTPITVKNTLKSGEFSLPQTGGMGTTLFYLLGTILTLGAAILLISRKRVSR